MSRRAVAAVAVLIAALACAVPIATAGAGPSGTGSSGGVTLTLTQTLGWVGAQITAPPGAGLQLAESVAGQAVPLGSVTVPSSGSLQLEHVVPWLCGRLTRTITAAQSGSSAAPATATITTPSCAGRLRLAVSRRRVAVGFTVELRVIDAWRTGGVSFQLCSRPPLSPFVCRTDTLGTGQRMLRAGQRLISPGAWQLALRTPWGQRIDRSVRASHPEGALSLLATGDSEIQEVDSDLAASLGPLHVGVHSDARVGTGISKIAQLNWVRYAAGQAARIRPDVTVMFIGANDGFALPDASGAEIPCCNPNWIGLFAQRTERIMRSYLRGGRGRVFWFTLPMARDAGHAQLFRAVNRAYREAAAEFRGGLELIRADEIFTPGGRYRQTMSYRGRMVDVRAADGIHLSPDGARIAAAAVLAAMRRGGLLG